MAEITLRKYHGLGNDYLIYDPNRNACELQERQVEALCRRNLGVGADGILYGPFFDGDKMRVRIFNPDGSEAEKSGKEEKTVFLGLPSGCRPEQSQPPASWRAYQNDG